MSEVHITGVWISGDGARVVRWGAEASAPVRIDSGIAARHRSTGRPPAQGQATRDGNRDEHIRAFFGEVAQAIPPDDDVLLVGDGELPDHFAEHIRAADAHHGHKRDVAVEKSGPVTDRQLVAMIRERAGAPARRSLPR